MASKVWTPLSGAIVVMMMMMMMMMMFAVAQSSALLQPTNMRQVVASVNSLLSEFKLDPDNLIGVQGNKLVSHQQHTQMEAIERELHALLEGTNNSSSDTHRFLVNLESNSHSCDQVSLDALMLIGNVGPKPRDSLLQTYARLKVDLCWQQFVSSFPAKLHKVMSKMPESTLEALNQAAGKVAEIRSADQQPVQGIQNRRAPAAIRIDDSVQMSPPSAATSGTDDVVQSMLRLEAIEELETDRQRREFALALNRLYNAKRELELEQFGPGGELNQRLDVRRFYERNYLRPCEQLIERVRRLASGGNIFKVHTRQTLGQALAHEKQQNVWLEYELQVYRVCGLVVSKADGVVEMLVGMRN